MDFIALYTPVSNLIEEFFSKVKTYAKS